MRTCESHDGVVVYDGRYCPWCAEVADLKEQHAIVHADYKKLEDEREDALNRLADITEYVDEHCPECHTVIKLRR